MKIISLVDSPSIVFILHMYIDPKFEFNNQIRTTLESLKFIFRLTFTTIFR